MLRQSGQCSNSDIPDGAVGWRCQTDLAPVTRTLRQRNRTEKQVQQPVNTATRADHRRHHLATHDTRTPALLDRNTDGVCPVPPTRVRGSTCTCLVTHSLTHSLTLAHSLTHTRSLTHSDIHNAYHRVWRVALVPVLAQAPPPIPEAVDQSRQQPAHQDSQVRCQTPVPHQGTRPGSHQEQRHRDSHQEQRHRDSHQGQRHRESRQEQRHLESRQDNLEQGRRDIRRTHPALANRVTKGASQWEQGNAVTTAESPFWCEHSGECGGHHMR